MSGRVIQMDYMNASQIDQFHLVIKRYLAEYLQQIRNE